MQIHTHSLLYTNTYVHMHVHTFTTANWYTHKDKKKGRETHTHSHQACRHTHTHIILYALILSIGHCCFWERHTYTHTKHRHTHTHRQNLIQLFQALGIAVFERDTYTLTPNTKTHTHRELYALISSFGHCCFWEMLTPSARARTHACTHARTHARTHTLNLMHFKHWVLLFLKETHTCSHQAHRHTHTRSESYMLISSIGHCCFWKTRTHAHIKHTDTHSESYALISSTGHCCFWERHAHAHTKNTDTHRILCIYFKHWALPFLRETCPCSHQAHRHTQNLMHLFQALGTAGFERDTHMLTPSTQTHTQRILCTYFKHWALLVLVSGTIWLWGKTGFQKTYQIILRLFMIVTTVIWEIGPILHLAPWFVDSVVLPIGGTLGGVAKDLDGVLHTALNVNFCTRQKSNLKESHNLTISVFCCSLCFSVIYCVCTALLKQLFLFKSVTEGRIGFFWFFTFTKNNIYALNFFLITYKNYKQIKNLSLFHQSCFHS